ncbi:MAG: hypothetical protein KF806_15275 [Nitrospira sp.]|nr:hypothetical protein [Nitrospira sp.]
MGRLLQCAPTLDLHRGERTTYNEHHASNLQRVIAHDQRDAYRWAIDIPLPVRRHHA